MKHSLFSFRPTRHLALGLGAAGLVLGASGASVAATALIQPAGALSVQVPAVAVREQNVNAAGRIRVALPKTSVGVNGSVSVSNLPLNSAGRLQTQNGSGIQQFATTQNGDPVNPGSTVDIVNVQGQGRFQGKWYSLRPVTLALTNASVSAEGSYFALVSPDCIVTLNHEGVGA